MPKKKSSIYICTECGNETSNWAGRCPSCGMWATLKEIDISAGSERAKGSGAPRRAVPKKMSQLDITAEIRVSTGISEFDRVLGGGAVQGSMILVGGAPGIGKSTLLLQMCRTIAPDQKILYVTAEESERQLKLRAMRLQVENEQLYVLAETELETILRAVEELEPDMMILDSIQTVSSNDIEPSPGSISQIRECTMKLMRTAKERGLTVFVVGHITKEGSIAGPKILEHMVDCVLYFEGEHNTSFRILRAAKNRFGSTNEIGVFEMVDVGLRCVPNPSEMLLSGRPADAPGTCVACVIEGTRPLLAEVQALVAPTNRNAARRSNGLDHDRSAMLLAVLEKRGGMPVGNCDAYINVVGGLDLDEPAADLATILAIASSYLDRPLGSDLAAVGEVGLAGEIRNVGDLEQRLTEIARIGFKRCVVPANIPRDTHQPEGLQLVPVKNVGEAVAAVLGKKRAETAQDGEKAHTDQM